MESVCVCYPFMLLRNMWFSEMCALLFPKTAERLHWPQGTEETFSLFLGGIGGGLFGKKMTH